MKPTYAELESELSQTKSEILQQAELPEEKAIITQYELLKYRCFGAMKPTPFISEAMGF